MPFRIADIIVILLITIGPIGKIASIVLAGLAVQLMLSAGTDLGLIAKASTEAH